MITSKIFFLGVCVLSFTLFSCQNENRLHQTNRKVIIKQSDIEKEMELFESKGIRLFNIETLDSNGNHKFIKKCDTTILKVTYKSLLYRNLINNPEIRLSKFYHTNYKLIYQNNQYYVITNDSTEIIGFNVWLKNKNVKFRLMDGRSFDNLRLSVNTLLVYE